MEKEETGQENGRRWKELKQCWEKPVDCEAFPVLARRDLAIGFMRGTLSPFRRPQMALAEERQLEASFSLRNLMSTLSPAASREYHKEGLRSRLVLWT